MTSTSIKTVEWNGRTYRIKANARAMETFRLETGKDIMEAIWEAEHHAEDRPPFDAKTVFALCWALLNSFRDNPPLVREEWEEEFDLAAAMEFLGGGIAEALAGMSRPTRDFQAGGAAVNGSPAPPTSPDPTQSTGADSSPSPESAGG